MNREIKFRAWDREEMHEDQLAKYLLSQGFDNSQWKDEFVFMQFTGLKDKNGKEIYEGDILKSLYTGILFSVGFDKGAFKCESGMISLSPHLFHKSEIIGNIYEHSHLLNPKP